MNLLWKKEINSRCYLDLFLSHRHKKDFKEWFLKLSSKKVWKRCYQGIMLDPAKSNAISEVLRKELGNKDFKDENKLDNAVEHYNQSLIFAETGTHHVNYAYGNRSACFMKMGMFDKCLVDIELAMKANCPEHLVAKLEQRKIDCLKLMETKETKRLYVEPKLSFDPKENFPCMANILTMKKGEKYGRYVEATCDIDVGKIILIENRFVFDVAVVDRVFCSTCAKECVNFIPCPECTDVVFCSEDCMDRNQVHKLACGATFYRMDPQIRLSIKAVLIAITAFPNVEDMIKFVEKALVNRDKIPEAVSDVQSNYGLFLTLYSSPSIELDMLHVYKVYTSVMDIPAVKKIFDSPGKQNFLMHLIGQHYLIEKTNGHGDEYSGSLSNVLSLFSHSCAPNTYNLHMDNREMLITTRPVKQGDQLFVSYLGYGLTTKERQRILKKQYEFVCKCEKCRPQFILAERQEMKRDPGYQYLINTSIIDYRHNIKRLERKQKCIDFLNKFGHLPWSQELESVIDEFENCISKDFLVS